MARPRAFDEEKVLCAVREQFWTAGYAATSMDDLMRVSGLGKGSLYAAFGDKRGLILRVLRDYATGNLEQLRRTVRETPRAIDALRSVVESPIAGSRVDDAIRRGCLLANSTTELGNTDPDVRSLAHQTYEELTGAIAECVVRACDEGDLTDKVEPVALARALLAAQQGIVYMGRTGMDPLTLASTARELSARLLPVGSRPAT